MKTEPVSGGQTEEQVNIEVDIDVNTDGEEETEEPVQPRAGKYFRNDIRKANCIFLHRAKSSRFRNLIGQSGNSFDLDGLSDRKASYIPSYGADFKIFSINLVYNCIKCARASILI